MRPSPPPEWRGSHSVSSVPEPPTRDPAESTGAQAIPSRAATAARSHASSTDPARFHTPAKTSAGALSRIPPSISTRSSTFMAGSINASDRAFSSGVRLARIAPWIADDRLDADGALEARHHEALFHVLVLEVRAGERRELEVDAVDVERGESPGVVAVAAAIAATARDAGVEAFVVGLDALGQRREVQLDRGLDVGVLVRGVRHEQLDHAVDVVGRGRPGPRRRRGRAGRPRSSRRTARRGCPCGCRGRCRRQRVGSRARCCVPARSWFLLLVRAPGDPAAVGACLHDRAGRGRRSLLKEQ